LHQPPPIEILQLSKPLESSPFDDLPHSDIREVATTILQSLLETMNISADVSVTVGTSISATMKDVDTKGLGEISVSKYPHVHVNIVGDNLSLLMGRKAETLKSLADQEQQAPLEIAQLSGKPEHR
jgi:predicted RNA-binding protein Jag